jgi:hypothetical protein
MTGPPPSPASTSDDDAWLDALAGRSTSSLDARELSEVEHLRKAWVTRKQSIDTTMPEIDGLFLQRLLDRRSEELKLSGASPGISPEIRPDIHAAARELQEGQVPPSKRTAANNPYFMWGVAASLMLFAVLVVPIATDRAEDDTQTPRSITSDTSKLRIVSDADGRRVSVGSSYILIEVADRDKEHKEIVNVASRLMVPVTDIRNMNGDYEIKVPSTLAGTELLYRISSVLPDQGGTVSIRITLPKK